VYQRTHQTSHADLHTLILRARNPWSVGFLSRNVRVYLRGGYLVARMRDVRGPDWKHTLPEGILHLAFLLWEG